MPVVVAGNPGEPPAPSIFCSAQRERLVIGPGPDAGGSNHGKAGCCQVPVKSGTEAFAFALAGLPAGGGFCASAGIAAIAATVTRSGTLICSDMTPPETRRSKIRFVGLWHRH